MTQLSGRSTTDNSGWKYPTSEDAGFHTIVTPQNSACRSLWFFRLNLEAGTSYELWNDTLEMSAAVIEGRVGVAHGDEAEELASRDSFYLPARDSVTITAREKAILYIGGAIYREVGSFFVRKYDPTLALGDVHQIHGAPPYEREVFMTVNQEVPASHLITGLTWGRDGQWTSWPPHQHDKDLEEVYCYFDIPAPKFALHISYTKPGEVGVVTPVSSGDCMIIPEGYHPTVAMPGVCSSYFWVMVAHSAESRRYDLAVEDPELI